MTSRAVALLMCALMIATDASAKSRSKSDPMDLGRSSHVVVIRVRAGDTAAEIARRYLNDPSLAWRVAPLSGGVLQPGGLATVALTPADAALTSVARYVPILCYHRFAAGRSTSRMEVSSVNFEAQLRWLRDQGWTVVPLRSVVDFVNGRAPLPAKSVAITIDDGYRSSEEIAAPLLRRYSDPATLFVYTDFVGTGAGLTWGEIAQVQQGGLIDVQSHSKTHRDMVKRLNGETPTEYAKRLQTEVYTPLSLLTEHGDTGLGAFAYPYGAADEQVESVVRGAGYRAGVTVARGGNPSWAPAMLLRRDMVFGDDSLATFSRRVETAAAGGAGAAEQEDEP